MACTDIIVKVVGDNQFITDQVTTVTDKANEVTNTAQQVKQDADSAEQSKQDAQTAASEAAQHLSDIKAHQNPFFTKNSDSLESIATKGYNFKGGGVTVTETSPDEFEINIPTPGDMLRKTYDPKSVNADAFERSNHRGEIPIATVTNLQTELDDKLDASEYTDAKVKSMYESNADTNAFTDADKTKLDSVDLAVDMKSSVYDPSGVNADAFNPDNFDFSKFPDDAVLTVVGGKLSDSRVLAKDGSVETRSNSLSIGPHYFSSAGENVMVKNLWNGKIFAPVWQQIEKDKSDLPTYRVYTDSAVADIFLSINGSDVLTNPSFSLTAPQNYRIWSFTLKPSKSLNGVKMRLSFNGRIAFDDTIGDFIAGTTFKYDLDSNTAPFDVYQGETFLITFYHEDEDVLLYGNALSGLPYSLISVRRWKEVPVSGGAGTGSGDMLKSVYDPNDDGIVDRATEADQAVKISGVDSVASGRYYGKDSNGNVGFHAITTNQPSEASRVIVREFTGLLTLSHDDLPVGVTRCFVFKGTSDKTLTLPSIASRQSPDDVLFYVVNASPNNSKLFLSIQSPDKWKGLTYVQLVSVIADTGYAVASDTSESSWHTVASLSDGAISDLKIRAQTNEQNIQAATTAITGHGTLLKQYGGLIQSNSNDVDVIKRQIPLLIQDVNVLRKNAANKITAEPNYAAKTITFKLMSETGLIDSVMVDLSPFLGGPVTTYPAYYGFDVDPSRLDSSSTVASGASREFLKIGGADINVTRNDADSKYIWIWIPDALGTVTGFEFSGFTSVWGSRPLTVNNVAGKIFTSPNKTATKNVTFEVRT